MTDSAVLAAHAWPTNGHLIADVARLYLNDTDHVLDPTYGRGVWWSIWRPTHLTASDLDPTKSPLGRPIDFRDLPWPANHFDAATFDPPYMAPGGRKTTSTDDFNDRFGLHTTPATPAENQALIDQGLTEVGRVVRPGGIVLVKCMDYINGGRLFPGTHLTLTAALAAGFFYEDRIEHVGRPGPQPSTNLDGSPRRPLHARRNLSTLFVLRAPRTDDQQALELDTAR